MLMTKTLNIDICNYRIVEGTSKKTNKPFKCFKLLGTVPLESSSNDSVRGETDVIEIFENYSPDFDIFYSKNKPATKVTIEGAFQNFKFSVIRIVDITF
jgi:hypothetical protein